MLETKKVVFVGTESPCSTLYATYRDSVEKLLRKSDVTLVALSVEDFLEESDELRMLGDLVGIRATLTKAELLGEPEAIDSCVVAWNTACFMEGRWLKADAEIVEGYRATDNCRDPKACEAKRDALTMQCKPTTENEPAQS